MLYLLTCSISGGLRPCKDLINNKNYNYNYTVHIIVIISFTLTYMPYYLTNFNCETVPVLMCIRITMVYNKSKVKDYIQKNSP